MIAMKQTSSCTLDFAVPLPARLTPVHLLPGRRVAASPRLYDKLKDKTHLYDKLKDKTHLYEKRRLQKQAALIVYR